MHELNVTQALAGDLFQQEKTLGAGNLILEFGVTLLGAGQVITAHLAVIVEPAPDRTAGLEFEIILAKTDQNTFTNDIALFGAENNVFCLAQRKLIIREIIYREVRKELQRIGACHMIFYHLAPITDITVSLPGEILVLPAGKLHRFPGTGQYQIFTHALHIVFHNDLLCQLIPNPAA